MTGREWKPGDVAMVTARWIRTEDHSERRAVRVSAGWTSRARIHVADWETSIVRPLVVIDPEDRIQVERLAQSYRDNTSAALPVELLTDRMQAALNALVKPPPTEVFEHYSHTQQMKSGPVVALCGKVWVPGGNVTVVGKCPECTDLVGSGWIA